MRSRRRRWRKAPRASEVFVRVVEEALKQGNNHTAYKTETEVLEGVMHYKVKDTYTDSVHAGMEIDVPKDLTASKEYTLKRLFYRTLIGRLFLGVDLALARNEHELEMRDVLSNCQELMLSILEEEERAPKGSVMRQAIEELNRLYIQV